MSSVVKTVVLLVCTAAVLVVASGPSWAQDLPARDEASKTDTAGRPDHDGDGVPNGQDEDWTGRDGSVGPGFVDADDDGRCDRLEDGEPCPRGRGKGWKKGRGRGGWGRGWKSGRGSGRRFVDQDGDGVCDRVDETRDCGRGRGLAPCGARGTQAP